MIRTFILDCHVTRMLMHCPVFGIMRLVSTRNVLLIFVNLGTLCTAVSFVPISFMSQLLTRAFTSLMVKREYVFTVCGDQSYHRNLERKEASKQHLFVWND